MKLDPIALEDAVKQAHERAIENSEPGFLPAWDDLPSKAKELHCTRIATDITAYFARLEADGLARQGLGYDLPRARPPSDWAIWTEKEPGFKDECFPVTIIRERP